MNKLERLKKYANGGKVAKLQGGHTIHNTELDLKEEMLDIAFENALKLTNPLQRQLMLADIRNQYAGLEDERNMLNPQAVKSSNTYMQQTKVTPDTSSLKFNTETNKVEGNIAVNQETIENPEEFFEEATSKSTPTSTKVEGNAGWKPTTQQAQLMGGAATAAINAVDGAVMGDKNFSASSKAIDTGVHIASGAMIKSGNPWAIGAAVALEGLNFATKAGGKNVPGYNVDINNSGYGNLGHQDSEAGRVWDTWSGAINRKLARRNEQARMALAAADISEDQRFEQEARANSVTNVLEQNKIALAGGIDTSLLGS